MLDVKTICQKTNISQQTFYRLIRENKEFSSIVENNRTKKGNGYKYGTPVLEWLYNYYDIKAVSNEQNEQEIQSINSAADANQDRISFLENENKQLQNRIAALETSLAEKENERKELFSQNAQLLLLLSQEKQEKQALLPAPKKTIGERIKYLFTSKKGN